MDALKKKHPAQLPNARARPEDSACPRRRSKFHLKRHVSGVVEKINLCGTCISLLLRGVAHGGVFPSGSRPQL